MDPMEPTMTPFEQTRRQLAATALAEAPSGDPCPSCGDLHETAQAEADCADDVAEFWTGSGMTITTTQTELIRRVTRREELIMAYHEGKVDASDVPGYRR